MGDLPNIRKTCQNLLSYEWKYELSGLKLCIEFWERELGIRRIRGKKMTGGKFDQIHCIHYNMLKHKGHNWLKLASFEISLFILTCQSCSKNRPSVLCHD